MTHGPLGAGWGLPPGYHLILMGLAHRKRRDVEEEDELELEEEPEAPAETAPPPSPVVEIAS